MSSCRRAWLPWVVRGLASREMYVCEMIIVPRVVDCCCLLLLAVFVVYYIPSIIPVDISRKAEVRFVGRGACFLLAMLLGLLGAWC